MTRELANPARTLAAWMGAMLLATAGCATTSQPGQPSAESVRVLSKADGWREIDAFHEVRPFGLVEIAFDRTTAQQAWTENVPAELSHRTGTPSEPGVYGNLDSVDFTTHAVIVWSAGQSGSCPGWLADIRMRDDGAIEITTGSEGGGADRVCTDDYNPYRMVLAVARDRLPAADRLPVSEVIVDGRATGLQSWVDGYPAAGDGWRP